MMTEMNASTNFSQFAQDLKNAFIAQSKCKPVYHRDGSISVSSIFRPESDSPKLRLYPSNVSHDIVTGISYSPGQNAAAAGVDWPSFTPAKRKLYLEARAERQRLQEREQARKGLIQQAEYLIACSLTDMTDIDEYARAFDSEMAWFERYIDDRAIDQFIAKQRREQAAIDHAIQQRIDELKPKPKPLTHLTDGMRRAMFLLCDNAKEIPFTERALAAELDAAFTIADLSAATGETITTTRRYVDKSICIEATGQKIGKSDTYCFVGEAWFRRFLREQALMVEPDKVRDDYNKPHLGHASEYDDLHPETPEKPIADKVLNFVAYKTKQRVRYLKAHLNDPRVSPLPLDEDNDAYIKAWIESQETDGLYHWEREQRTGLDIATIRYYLCKNGMRFRACETKAKPVRIIRKQGAVLITREQAKRQALRRCKLSDPSIKAVKWHDSDSESMTFEPVPPRKIENIRISLSDEAAERRQKFRISSRTTKRNTKSNSELLDKEQLQYALPAFPRRSITWSKDKADAYDLWQLIIAKLHAGKALLIERGKHRILTDMNGKWVKPDIDTVRQLEEKPPPPDGYIEVNGTLIPF